MLLMGSMIGNYVLAKYILARPRTAWSKRILVFGIVANLFLLGIYKYLGFLTFTFQQISYLCDSHAGKMEASSHTPLEYALFVTFFPQLIAGPIVHHAEMMPQFRKVISPGTRAIMLMGG